MCNGALNSYLKLLKPHLIFAFEIWLILYDGVRKNDNGISMLNEFFSKRNLKYE